MEASIAEDIASICSSVKPSEEKEVLAIDRSSDSVTPFTFISDSKPISKCSFLSYSAGATACTSSIWKKMGKNKRRMWIIF